MTREEIEKGVDELSCRVHVSVLTFPSHRLDTSRLRAGIFYGTTCAERFP
jgi:hypothetical protein